MPNRPHPATAAEIAATLAEALPEELDALLARYADDPRAQVRRACASAVRRAEKQQAERERVEGMYSLMRELGGEGIAVLDGAQAERAEITVAGMVVVHRIASLIESVSLLSL